MILYFSATGNSAYAAKWLAKATEDYAVSMEEVSGPIEIAAGERLGVVCPTYFYGLPAYVEDFLEQCEMYAPANTYAYAVATYGSFCGQVCELLGQKLQQKGIELSARFSVRMPDTWTPVFDLSDPTKVAKIMAEEPAQLAKIADRIKKERKNKRAKRQVPMKVVQLYHPNYEKFRKTKYLWTTDRCTGCGKCADNCPTGTIEMKNGRPFLPKSKCSMCLRCLHQCPVFAMQYSDQTMNHGQYTHPEEL